MSSFEFSCVFLNRIFWQQLCLIPTLLFPDSIFCYMYLKIYNCTLVGNQGLALINSCWWNGPLITTNTYISNIITSIFSWRIWSGRLSFHRAFSFPQTCNKASQFLLATKHQAICFLCSFCLLRVRSCVHWTPRADSRIFFLNKQL